MTDVVQLNAASTFRVELDGGQRFMRWGGESTSVVFCVSSGNTFEIDAISTNLIERLKVSPLTVEEAFLLAEANYAGLDQKSAFLRFQKDYLEPLHQLDLIRLSSL